MYVFNSLWLMAIQKVLVACTWAVDLPFKASRHMWSWWVSCGRKTNKSLKYFAWAWPIRCPIDGFNPHEGLDRGAERGVAVGKSALSVGLGFETMQCGVCMFLSRDVYVCKKHTPIKNTPGLICCWGRPHRPQISQCALTSRRCTGARQCTFAQKGATTCSSAKGQAVV